MAHEFIFRVGKRPGAKYPLYYERSRNADQEGGRVRFHFADRLVRTGKEMFGMPEVKTVGIKKSIMRILAAGKSATVRTSGDVHKVLRFIRDVEALQLDDIDAQIKALQARRIWMVDRAWENGHYVSLKLVREECEAVEAALKRIKEGKEIAWTTP